MLKNLLSQFHPPRGFLGKTADHLSAAGFRPHRVEYKPMKPVMAFCVLAKKE